MTANKIAFYLIAVLCLIAGCTPPPPVVTIPPPVASPPPEIPKPKSYVVLLENEDGTTGAITVSNAQGTQLLDQKGYGIDLNDENKPLDAPYKVDDEKIKADFVQTLSTVPDPPINFLLYFEFGTSILTKESQPKIDEILSAIKKRNVYRIGIIGHTDSSGKSAANYQLGLSRAVSVRKILLEAGVKADDIGDVISHGENNPLIMTAKGVKEPRNRRVEMIVW